MNYILEIRKYFVLNRTTIDLILKEYENLIFDLDDTLYEETIYLFAVYKEIGYRISEIKEINQNVIRDYLINEFTISGRKDLFNKLIEEFKIDKSFLNDALNILRNIKLKTKIPLFTKMNNILVGAKENFKRIFILTNGNKQQQINKINQLEWPISINDFHVIFADDIEPKPSPKSLLYILNKFSFDPDATVMIGDSNIDELCALRSNVKFIYVNRIF